MGSRQNPGLWPDFVGPGLGAEGASGFGNLRHREGEGACAVASRGDGLGSGGFLEMGMGGPVRFWTPKLVLPNAEPAPIHPNSNHASGEKGCRVA